MGSWFLKGKNTFFGRGRDQLVVLGNGGGAGIVAPAVISSLSAGTQTAGDVAVSYAIDKDDSAVQYRLFEAADATDAAAAAAANFSGYTVNDSGTVALTVSGSPANITIVSGLDSDALVSLDYFLAFRPAGSTVWSITGAIDLDTTDPVLSLATGTQTGQTTANISVSTTEGQGTLWRAVYPAASPPADIAALKAGTGAAWSGNGTPTAGVNAFSATGLTAGTEYRAWFLQEDEQGNQNPSGMVSSATFTTASVSSTPSHVGSTGMSVPASGGGNSLDISGLGLQEDDWVFLVLVNDGDGITIPSGFVSVYDEIGLSTPQYAVCAKQMGATPDTSITIAQNGTTAIAAAASAYRDLDGTTPYQYIGRVNRNGNAVVAFNEVTPNSADDIILCFAGLDDASTGNQGAGTDYTLVIAQNATTGTNPGQRASSAILHKIPAGSTTAQTPPDFEFNFSDDNFGVTVLLRAV